MLGYPTGRIVVGVEVAVAVSEAGRTRVVGVAQMDRDLACPRPPGRFTCGTQSGGHPVGLRGGRQMHHGMGQVELGFREADKLDGMGASQYSPASASLPRIDLMKALITS